MPKPEPKGNRVKTFKKHIPQPDLSYVETQVVVYFKDDAFFIYQGEHMMEACQGAVEKCSDFHERAATLSVYKERKYIRSKIVDNVVRAFETLCTLYVELLKSEKKVRVIRFSFARNRPYVEGSEHKPVNDMHFAGNPALHFDYELLWRVGDKLYRQQFPESPLQFAGDVARRSGNDGEAETCVDWTAEREAFFADMRKGLIMLINRIEDFQGNLEKNVDSMIAGGPSMLLLPAAAKAK